MYVLHHHSQTCCCGHTEHWSHLYIAVTPNDPTRLKACDHSVPPDATIEVTRIPGKLIPVCAACVPADAAIRGAAARAAFEAARRRKHAEAAQPPPSAQKRFTTIDDLA